MRDSRTDDGSLASTVHATGLIEQAPIGILLVDTKGRVRSANRAALDLLGLRPEGLLTAATTDAFRLVDTLAGPLPSILFRRILRPDNSTLWARLELRPLTSGRDGLAALYVTDVSTLRSLETERQATDTGLDLLVAYAPRPLALTDDKGRLLLWNPASTRLTGRPPEEVLGGPFAAALGIEPGLIADLIESTDAGHQVGIEGVVTRGPDGRDRTIDLTAMALVDGARRVPGVVWTIDDTTAASQRRSEVLSNESRLRKILANINDAITIIDAEGNTQTATGLVTTTLGYPTSFWEGLNVLELIHPADQERAIIALADIQKVSGARASSEFRVRSADGDWQIVEGTAVNLLDDPEVGGILLTTRNISDRRRQENQVRAQAKVLGLVASGAPLADTLTAIADFVEVQCDDGRCGVLLSSPRQASVLHTTKPLDQGLLEAVAAAVPRSFDEAERPVPVALGNLPGVAELADVRIALGDAGWRSAIAMPVIAGASGQILGQIVSVHEGEHQRASYELDLFRVAADLAAIAIERSRNEARLAHQALHDELTGLANRQLLLDRVDQALSRAKRRGGHLALMFLDLDRFKAINDSLGHDAGDLVLCEFADRLRTLVRPEDTVARLGGDEFVVLVEQVDDERDIAVIAERLERGLQRPFLLSGNEYHVTASVGIVVSHGGDEHATELLRNADTAMYRAKESGRARVERFDETLRDEVIDRLRLETDLRKALANNELSVLFQPMVDLSVGQVIGIEALIRWNHAERGLVSADVLVSIAEETGIIIPIGTWVIEQAVAVATRLSVANPNLYLAVNVSPRQLSQADIVSTLDRVLRANNFDANQLIVDLNESALIEPSSAVADSLGQLKRLGMRLAVDDFGTGSSSLSSLHRLPIDIVKIHNSFVSELGTTSGRAAVLRAAVSMAQALGLASMAEGVETDEQLAELRRLGVGFAQGHRFSTELDEAGVAALLARGARW